MQPNLLIQQYRRTLNLYYKFNRRLKRRLKNHNLHHLSIKTRNRWLRNIEKLKHRLTSLTLQMRLGVGTASLCLYLGIPKVSTGQEFRINTYTPGNQSRPAIATDKDGDFVITWSSEQDGDGRGVYAQLHNATGVAQGEEFRVNTYTSGDQYGPSIAMDNDGDFVITWRSDKDGDGYFIFAQRFNTTGMAQGPEFQVNSTPAAKRWTPAVAMDSDGDFVITWVGESGYSGIYAQRFNAQGETQGAELQVNTLEYSQSSPSIAMDSDGDFVITWTRFVSLQDDTLEEIYAQRYNAAGVAQGSEFKVNTYTRWTQDQPSVAMDSDGDFVIAWHDGYYSSYYGSALVPFEIYAQRYNTQGKALGEHFQVSTLTTVNHVNPSVAMDNDGDFVIAWGNGRFYSGVADIYARRYNATGQALDVEFQVNSHITNAQFNPSISMTSEDNFVIAWESLQQDGEESGIYARLYPKRVTGVGTHSPIPKVHIYSHLNKVHCNFPYLQAAASQILVYEMNGKLIRHIDNSLDPKLKLEIPLELSTDSGIYLVKVVSIKYVAVQRVLLRN